jgi:hypothetical protein
VDAVYVGMGVIALYLLLEIMLTVRSIDNKKKRRFHESPNRGRH